MLDEDARRGGARVFRQSHHACGRRDPEGAPPPGTAAARSAAQSRTSQEHGGRHRDGRHYLPAGSRFLQPCALDRCDGRSHRGPCARSLRDRAWARQALGRHEQQCRKQRVKAMPDRPLPPGASTANETFRAFLERLRSTKELVDIRQSVDIRHIATLVDQADKALLFHDVNGYDMPVVSGIIRTRERAIMSMGCESYPEIEQKLQRGIDQPIPPRYVETAAHKQVI